MLILFALLTTRAERLVRVLRRVAESKLRSNEVGPTWSLITVTYNSRSAIQGHWESFTGGGDCEWIVIDNASTDDSASLAESFGARVTVLPKNIGFSAANNVGLARAIGDYVGFVNPDVRVDPRSLERLSESIERTGGFVSPQLVNPDGSPQPNGRGLPTLARKVGHRLGKSPRGYRVIAKPTSDPIPVCWAMGAALAGRTRDFQRIGGWNEDFFVYYEDHEIGIRSWRNKIPTHIDGAVTWEHAWARETASFRLRPWILELGSMRKFYSKYPALLGSARFASRLYPYLPASHALSTRDNG